MLAILWPSCNLRCFFVPESIMVFIGESKTIERVLDFGLRVVITLLVWSMRASLLRSASSFGLSRLLKLRYRLRSKQLRLFEN